MSRTPPSQPLLRPPCATAQDIPNAQCAICHAQGVTYGPDRVHWNQNEENAAKYKVNIDSALYDPATRKVSVRYSVSDPTSSNAQYNLVTPDCTYPAPNVCTPPTGTNNTQFGNLRFYVAYQNMVGQPTSVTEFSAYNNGGSGANALLYRGTNDGSNTYTVDITLPADTATAVAAGSARIVGVGQVKEPKLEVAWATDPRPPVSPTEYVSVVVQHTFKDFAISGSAQPAPRDRLERQVQRLPRRARHDVGLEHAGQRLPRRRAQHGRGLRAVPRPEPLLVDRDDQRPRAERELLVQAHDPRHPRQLEAPVSVHARQQRDRRLRQDRPSC